MKTTDKIIKILEKTTAYYSSRYDKKESKIRNMYSKDKAQQASRREEGELLELATEKGMVRGLQKATTLVWFATKHYNSTKIVTDDERLLNLLIKPVSDLNLTIRAKHCMWNNYIYFVHQLARYKKEELKSGKNVGRRTIDNIEEELAKIGLSLGMEGKIKRYLFKRAERITAVTNEMPDM